MCLLGERGFPLWNHSLNDAIMRALQPTGASIQKSCSLESFCMSWFRSHAVLLISVPIFSSSRGRGKNCTSDVYLTIEVTCSSAEKNKSKTKGL